MVSGSRGGDARVIIKSNEPRTAANGREHSRSNNSRPAASTARDSPSELGQHPIAVSYTHLDVYKRQEQNTARALDVADRVCVLSSGVQAFQGTAAEARASGSMFTTFLGAGGQ